MNRYLQLNDFYGLVVINSLVVLWNVLALHKSSETRKTNCIHLSSWHYFASVSMTTFCLILRLLSATREATHDFGRRPSFNHVSIAAFTVCKYVSNLSFSLPMSASSSPACSVHTLYVYVYIYAANPMSIPPCRRVPSVDAVSQTKDRVQVRRECERRVTGETKETRSQVRERQSRCQDCQTCKHA